LLPLGWRRPKLGLALLLGCAVGAYCFVPYRPFAAKIFPGTGLGWQMVTYNCRFFNSGAWFSEQYRDSTRNPKALEAKAWLLAHPAEIKCLQEFFDDVNSPIFNNEKTLLAGGKYASFFVAKPKHDNGVRFGLAIFSTFPIIGRGEVFLSKNTYNGAIYADVVRGRDTIRVVNVHLESARLSRQAGIRANLGAYTRAAAQRAAQTDSLLVFIDRSPYPVLLGGDFNETPASYVYQRLARRLAPTFAEAGQGWGGTYLLAGWPLPQIDHQFCQAPWRAIRHQVRGDLRTSDHLPIEAEYQLRTGER
jgi:endonuclease/exonuclease/phosphatase family metal-dependent hydrolase